MAPTFKSLLPAFTLFPMPHTEKLLKDLEILTERLRSKEVLSIGKDINYFADFVLDSPLPMWLKSMDGSVIFVNPAYTHVFGVALEDYIGKKDSDVWQGEEKAYRSNDEEVMCTGRGRFFVEEAGKVRTNVPNHILVYKWPLYDDNGNLLGVAGMSIIQYTVSQGWDDG